MTKFILIQPRDIEIFHFLYDNKFATTKQLQKKFFPDCIYEVAQKRIRFLKKYGYISSVRHPETCQYLYYCNKKSIQYLISEDAIPANAKPLKVDLYEVKHDSSVVDVVLALDAVPFIKNIKSDGQIERSSLPHLGNKIPDVTFSIDLECTYNLAVEVELSRKLITRYRSIFNAYYWKKETDAVLYMVRDESLLKALTGIEETLSKDKDKKIYFGLLDQFKADPLNYTFVNTAGQKIALKYLNPSRTKIDAQKYIDVNQVTKGGN